MAQAKSQMDAVREALTHVDELHGHDWKIVPRMADLGTTSNPFLKAPAAVKDYAVNWLPWLVGDSISTSTWIVPNGITKDSDSFTTTQTKIWLSGGTAESRYQVTNRIVTAENRVEERTISLYCTET